jgi:hypothetical protein
MTKTQSPVKLKAETPFPAKVPWAWNESIMAGQPTRQRAQSVVGDDERKTGCELIAAYRLQERISADNDVESRQHWLDKEQRLRMVTGVELQKMRAEMVLCDNAKFLDAQAKLRELRETAFRLVEPIIRRLIQSYDSELSQVACEAEARLDRTGLPIRQGTEWMLHGDSTCRAIWSCRHSVERTLDALSEHHDGIGSAQYFCTDEVGVPFAWLT